MVIKSQIGDSIYMSENIERIHTNERNEICCYTLTGCHHKLGSYSDGQTASDVLTKLGKAITSGVQFFRLPPNAEIFMQNNSSPDAAWNRTQERQRKGVYR